MPNTLSNEEKRISAISIWVWRNLLASGIFLICFVFLYNKCESIEDTLIEVKTVLQERIRLDRGDYGWAEPSMEEKEDIDWEKGDAIRKHINDFAD